MQCLVCCDGLESSTLTKDEGSLNKFQNMYNAFRKYMHFKDEFKESFDFRNDLFPFCRYCKLMLTQLLHLHEQSEYLSKLITQISAQFSSMILESTNKQGSPGLRIPSGGGRSKRKKAENDDHNLAEIISIRQAVIKQFSASLKLTKDVHSQSPIRNSPVKPNKPLKIEPLNSEDYGFVLGLNTEVADENYESQNPLNSSVCHQDEDNNESHELGGMESDDPDYHIPDDDRYETPSPDQCKPKFIKHFKKEERERVKELGDNKFLFEEQIPFEIVDGNYKCGACSYECTERRELLCIHIPKEHLGAEGERVPLTKKIDENKFLYREKYPFELINEVYHCGTCPFVTNRKDGIQQHIKIRHYNGIGRKHRQFSLEETEPGKFLYGEKFTFQKIEGGFKCDTCQSTKERRVKMLLHLRSVHMEPPNVHACDKCGKLFREKRKLLQHHATHSEDRPFVCDICNKAFKLAIVLHTHKKKHLGDDAKKHVCEMCGKRFWNNFLLKEHMTTHTGEKVFQCTICLKTFARNATRKLHMELHNLEKTFMCELCGRSYSSQIHLNRHIASHNRDRKRKRKSPVKKVEEEVPQEVEIEATNIVEDFLEL